MFIADSDFGARKKAIWNPDTSSSIFPTQPGKGQIPHPREGLTCQIPHSPGTEHSQMPGVCPGGGMLKFRFDRRITTAHEDLKVNLNFNTFVWINIIFCRISFGFKLFVKGSFRNCQWMSQSMPNLSCRFHTRNRPVNSHGLTVRLTVWGINSWSHSLASKSHHDGESENLEN